MAFINLKEEEFILDNLKKENFLDMGNSLGLKEKNIMVFIKEI